MDDTNTRLGLNVSNLDHILTNYGVSTMSVFGSYAKGDAHADSDVDLLVKFHKPIGLLKFIRLERELAEALGRDVDLVSEVALSPYLRDEVLSSAELVYEAD